MDILATEFSAAEFLEQLEAEHHIKPEVREMRNIGLFNKADWAVARVDSARGAIKLIANALRQSDTRFE